MIEIRGNAFDLLPNYTGLCITTNGFVKNNGECVMGRGIALGIKNKVPSFPKVLGQKILQAGNHVHRFDFKNKTVYSFPVKHNWWEVADIELIKRSCMELMAKLGEDEKVLLPRPGCGNGKLMWEDVKPQIERLLDDRVHVVTL